MAINEDTGHRNVNTLYLGASGSGKSQALGQSPEIPARGARVVLWDIDHDHPATRFKTMKEFISAIRSALKSGRGFRIAYSGDDTPEIFENFCSVVWSLLDGNKTTYVIVEELADVSTTTGKAKGDFGRVLRKGRKFGARLHLTTQRGAEISKTAYTQCPIKFIGMQGSETDIKRIVNETGIQRPKMIELSELQFYIKKSGQLIPDFKELKYKKPKHKK